MDTRCQGLSSIHFHLQKNSFNKISEFNYFYILFFQVGTIVILTDDKHHSYAQMVHNSHKLYLFVIGGLMLDAIYHQNYTQLIQDYIRDRKLIQQNLIEL